MSSRYKWLESVGSLDGTFPVRKIGPSPVKNTGRISTRKANQSQTFESLLERDFLILLDVDPRVVRIGIQPITLRWATVAEKVKEYTPDVVVHYDPSSIETDPRLRTTLFEVKPRAILKRKWSELQPKFKAAVAWAREHECRFKIVTEVEIQTPYLENVRILRHYRPDRMGPPSEEALKFRSLLLEQLARCKQTTPRNLLEMVTNSWDEQARLIPQLWALVNDQVIGIDLSASLTMASPIWLSGKATLPEGIQS